jgi:hypothetical protein
MPPTFAFIEILLIVCGALTGHLPNPVEIILYGVYNGMI